MNAEAKAWKLHSDSSTNGGNTANHMCKVGAWRRRCPRVMVTNKAWQSGNSGHLRVMRDTITVQSKGTRNLKSDTVWSYKTVSGHHGGVGWGWEVTLRKLKSISNTMLTTSYLLRSSRPRSGSQPVSSFPLSSTSNLSLILSIPLQNISQIHSLLYLHQYFHIKPL